VRRQRNNNSVKNDEKPKKILKNPHEEIDDKNIELLKIPILERTSSIIDEIPKTVTCWGDQPSDQEES
jgi:hypothetical protein